MERIKSGKSEELAPVRLYRENLEELAGLFGRTCETVQLSDQEFEYDSLSEIERRNGAESRLSYLEISGRNPYVSLSLGAKKLTWLFRNENNRIYAEAGDQSELLASRITSYLSQRKRFLPSIFNWNVGLIAFVLQIVWLTIWISNYGKDVNFYRNHHWGVVVDICYFVLLAYAIALPFVLYRGMTWISLGPKHSRKSFWHEHGYDLFKSIFLVALGIALKSLFDYFMK